MEWMNDFLRSQPEGGIPNYNTTGTVAQIVMIVVVLLYLLRTRTALRPFIQGVIIAAVTYYAVPVAQSLMVWYRVGFDPAQFTAHEGNLALGFTLLPLLAWLCAKVLRASVAFSGDVAAVTMLGFHVVGRFGCVFTGCCYGFPCDGGLYSAVTGANQFPVCVVESLYTLAILVFLFGRVWRHGYTPDGKNLPYFLLIYGVCRFFSEMTRESTAGAWLFWRISDIHLHALVMALVGGILLYVQMQREKETAICENAVAISAS